MSNENVQKSFEVEQNDSIIIIVLTKNLEKEQTNQQAELVVRGIESIFQKNPGMKFGIAFDLTPLQSLPGFITEKSRQIYSEFSKNLQIYKIAIVGASLFYKIATNFLVTASRRGSVIKWFTTPEEAKKWLKAEGS